MRNKFGSFEIGHVPWNKGTKGKVKPNKGTFKKGHRFPAQIEEQRIKKVEEILTKRPKLEIDKSLAYMLGLMIGDGFITCNKYTNAKIIGFQNTEKKLVENFARCLEQIGLNPYICINTSSKNSFNKKILYRVQACSKVFYSWYLNLNMDYLKKELNTVEKIVAFIRGFYEAEGTIFVDKNNRFHLSFSNTNFEILNLVKNLLKKIEFQFNLNGPYESKSLGKKLHYELRTNKQTQIPKFIQIIKPNIKDGGFLSTTV